MAVSVILSTLVALSGCSVVVDAQADRREARAEASFPPRGEFVALDDGRQVHAVVAGEGPDLVLIHGANGSTRDFTFSFVDRLTDRYRVIVLDRPGLGWTDRASGAYGGAFNTAAESPREQARMLQEAAAKLGADRPLVLGHSYGGAVALAWALETPDNLSGLVVLAGASNPWRGGLGPLYEITASAVGGALVVPVLTAFAPTSRTEDTVGTIFAPQPVPEGYVDYVGVGLTLRRETFRANARQVNSLFPHVVEMSKHYPGIRVPTEIVHGDADDIVPMRTHALPLVRQIPEARLTRLEGIGHMPHHVAPHAVEAAIDRAAARAGLR